jgi:hypothetical protein
LFTRNARSCSDIFACFHPAFLIPFFNFGSHPRRCRSRRSHLCALWMRPIHPLYKRISRTGSLLAAGTAFARHMSCICPHARFVLGRVVSPARSLCDG